MQTDADIWTFNNIYQLFLISSVGMNNIKS